MMPVKSACLLALAVGILGFKTSAQNIAWGPATTITGDANLATGGTYVDGLLPNQNASSSLTADGITFHPASTVKTTTAEDDGYNISLVSGGLTFSFYPDNFPSGGGSSAAFAAVMDSGGLYQTGHGTGTVTLYGLTPGQNYAVQVYSYINDGDYGYTTLSGSTPVTIANAPPGLFSTGTFTATGTTETFNWTGIAPSSYTVFGAIALFQLPASSPPTIAQDTTPRNVTAYENTNTTTKFTVGVNGSAPITNQWFTSTDGGVTFNPISGATSSILTLTNSQVGTNIEYEMLAANAFGSVTSTPASLTVLFVPAQTIVWGPATTITGDANLAVASGSTYVDGLLPSENMSSSLTVDGMTFNPASTVKTTTAEDDGFHISLVSGGLPFSFYGGPNFGDGFPTTSPSSTAFAAVMDAGGIYQTPGNATGTVYLYGLTPGRGYAVQVYSFIPDNDAGLTTLSGSNSVTLSNDIGGHSGQGQFSTGTFTATATVQSFNWQGAGSGYTVFGAIALFELTTNLPPTIAEDTTPSTFTAYVGTTSSFSAVFNGTAPITNQWFTSTDGGVTFNAIPGATGPVLTLTNSQAVTNIEYELVAANAFGSATSTPALLTVVSTPPQTITWGPATGISGDNSLLTNGVSLDAFIPNVSAGDLIVDGIIFNGPSTYGPTEGDDGIISFNIINGDENSYYPGTFPSTPPSSSAFATLMRQGGYYADGGVGFGLITITNLTAGDSYSVQVFNYNTDGNANLTTFTGSNSVTLNDLANAGGPNTYGEYAIGTFTASATSESFFWQGAGSSKTLFGTISVLDISSVPLPILSQDTTPSAITASLNSTSTFGASFIGVQPITNQWQISTDGGVSFNNVPGATLNTLTLTNSLVVTNVEYRLVASNNNGSSYSTPATLTVIPAPGNDIYWTGPLGMTGDANLVTSGTFYDGLMPNTALGAALTVDGLSFNVATTQPDGSYGDGKIDYTGIGLVNFAWNNSFPTSGNSSSAFAKLMDNGGIFQYGGAGTGTVLVNGLTPGHTYTIQVFNWAPDGDPGLTTYTGTNSVTIGNLAGAAGLQTYGEYATGSFIASNTREEFTWQGQGSLYTLLGSILVADTTGVVATNAPTLSSVISGIQMQLSWPPDHTGWTLQVQTNSLGAGLGTNWVNVPSSTGINSFSAPIVITNGCVFYRLVYP